MISRFRAKHPGTPLRAMLFYEFIRWLTWRLFRLIYRARAYGLGRIPRHGAVLLVANHQSYLDPPAVGSAVGCRHMDFIARLGLFNSKLLARLITALNSMPIKEEGGDTAAIKEVLRRLGDGRAVLIFPEGTRSEDGAMHEFKRGAAVLVKRSQCPVLPVAVEGCYDAWPRGRKFPKLRGARVAVAFGDPIDHDDLMSGSADEALKRLEREVDKMRRALRAKLRRASGGRFPARGPGDAPVAAAMASGLRAT